MTTQETVFEIELRNHPGALLHVVGLFARRACNIEKLVCLPSDGHRMSRLWLWTSQADRADQMARFVARLEDVISVTHKSQ